MIIEISDVRDDLSGVTLQSREERYLSDQLCSIFQRRQGRGNIVEAFKSMKVGEKAGTYKFISAADSLRVVVSQSDSSP